MIISLFMPVRSGSCFIFWRSSPAVTAQVARHSEHEAPAVTNPASAPVSSAMCSPTFSCNSSMRTKLFEASVMAAETSGAISVPLIVVSVPTALMKVRTPSLR